jgi:Lon-like protease
MKLKRIFKIALLASAVSILGFFVKIDYFIIMPSRAVDLREIVLVENADEDDLGSFYLVTVSQQRAAPFTAIFGLLHPHMDLNSMESVIPTGMSETEYRALLTENMAESRYLAQVVALRRVGFKVEIISDGVEVIGFLDDAPATGIMEEGDKIISVDGEKVFLASEVPLLVQNRSVGETVRLNIVRNGKESELKIVTGAHPEDPEMPYLGIYIKTLPWEPVLPINIDMDTGRIGGPSAGLMFSLEIMNQYLPEDLTAGYKIAGTGTIDLNENIGRIGGVFQKVISAEEAGADYFFLPTGNLDDAKKAARKIELVPVADLQEALDFLSSLEAVSSF